jgi:2-dehydropantoate 2-reductase
VEIQTALAAGGVSSTVSDNIVAEMWAKFCAFAANATISTLTRARSGEIAAAPAGPAFVDSVFDDCARVATAEGYSPPREMGELVRTIYARAGSTYAPSILTDMERGRLTEGEFTIGDLVRCADRHGMDVPILRAALCNLQVHDARSSMPTLAGST